jgi:hypothetical protein
VSLSPSNTRPFDLPEFILTLRCRHPACGHCFARVSYTVSTILFGPFRGLYNSPLPWCYIGRPPPETRTRNWFPVPFRKVAVPSVRIEVDFSFPLFPYSLVAFLSGPPHQEPTRRGQLETRKLPLVGVSISEPIGPSLDVHPAETDPVPPEQLPILGALSDPAPMQILV